MQRNAASGLFNFDKAIKSSITGWFRKKSPKLRFRHSRGNGNPVFLTGYSCMDSRLRRNEKKSFRGLFTGSSTLRRLWKGGPKEKGI
jgi:hypothetical protein